MRIKRTSGLVIIGTTAALLLTLGILLKQHTLLRVMTSFVCLDCIGIGGLFGP